MAGCAGSLIGLAGWIGWAGLAGWPLVVELAGLPARLAWLAALLVWLAGQAGWLDWLATRAWWWDRCWVGPRLSVCIRSGTHARSAVADIRRPYCQPTRVRIRGSLCFGFGLRLGIYLDVDLNFALDFAVGFGYSFGFALKFALEVDFDPVLRLGLGLDFGVDLSLGLDGKPETHQASMLADIRPPLMSVNVGLGLYLKLEGEAPEWSLLADDTTSYCQPKWVGV